MNQDVEIAVKKPSECTEVELKDFASFVLAGGEVAAEGLDIHIRNAEALVFLRQNGYLKAIAAIKNPELSYKSGIFSKAQASVQDNKFTFELGWVFVSPLSRGFHFSSKLVKAALDAIDGHSIYATSRSDNIAMHKALERYGFVRHGNAYKSNRGDYELILFIKNDI